MKESVNRVCQLPLEKSWQVLISMMSLTKQRTRRKLERVKVVMDKIRTKIRIMEELSNRMERIPT